MCTQRAEVEDDFIRTGDVLCLYANDRGYLAAEGFGSQHCRLERDRKNKDLPFELTKCTLRLEDALSTHAMFAQGPRNREKSGACCSRILVYGQAVLLQHSETKKFLCCLPLSHENEKAAYQIGFGEYTDNGKLDEDYWFSIRPATSHRSTGEKVRNGDEIHLVNVANERYLCVHAGGEGKMASQEWRVQASIHQYIWSLQVVSLASIKQEAIGSLNGGDVIRLLHRHGEECLLVEYSEDGCEQEVCFNYADPKYNLSPLWCVELFTMKFGWGFVGWGQSFRLRHKITGKFLGLKNLKLALLDTSEASNELTAFCLFSPAMNSSTAVEWEEDMPTSMGRPDITFGDSVVYLYHISSQQWVGCLPSNQSKELGRTELLHTQQNQNFALTITRASEEHSQASTLIQSFQNVMLRYKNCVLLSSEDKDILDAEVTVMAMLSHLCDYFKTPDTTLSYDVYQSMLCTIRERQNLFQHQGIPLLTPLIVLETSKNCTKEDSKAQKILHKFYALMTAMIRGNHGNCKAFATEQWLETFIGQLELSWLVDDVLDVFLCLLKDSPEFLNIFTDAHINAVVQLFNKEGRNVKVLKLLSSLCVCHDTAIRDKQRLICSHLLNYDGILLKTNMCQKIKCAHLNVYVGVSSSALSKRWYYEVKVIEMNSIARGQPHLRAGWAHATNFCAHPTSNGDTVTVGGLGDDMYSVGFDGHTSWVEGCNLNQSTVAGVAPGDVMGCCIDLEKGVVHFTLNGIPTSGYVKISHLTELVTPSVSLSTGVSLMMALGGRAEKFTYHPPAGYTGLCDAILPDKVVEVLMFDNPGHGHRIQGPLMISDSHGFVPTVIEIKEDIPDPIKCVQEQLAKNLHEVWSKNKIDSGYIYGPVRDDKLKQHPCLVPYENLSESEKAYDRSMALSTLKTLLALGYSISLELDSAPDPPFLDLDPSKYQQSNGYLPKLLDLSKVNVDPVLLSLVDQLAENLHNVWASSKIREGWTYGLASADAEKRNPALVPYSCLSVGLKKSNYDTALETVRTMCGLGCVIEPPVTSAGSLHDLRRKQADHVSLQTRTFRAQRCFAVTHGRWCFEVKILTDGGTIRVGWASPNLDSNQILGTDDSAFCFDGYLGSKWHQHSSNFGQRWKTGDIVCCMVDMDLRTIAFALNGKMLEDDLGSVYAFEHIVAQDGLVPAIMLSTGQEAEFSFGQSKEFFNQSHANMGYLPLAQLSGGGNCGIPLWYTCPDTIFYPISDTHPRLKVSLGGRTDDDNSNSVGIHYRHWDYAVHRSRPECLRLNVGVRVGTAGSPIAQGVKVSYTAIIPAGHDPKTVFIGWTTSNFRFWEEEGKEEDRQQAPRKPGQRVEWSQEPTFSDTFCTTTAYLICLAEVLKKPKPSFQSPLSVACVLDSSKGDISFHLIDLGSEPPILTMTTVAPCKLFPTIVLTSPMEHLVTIDYTPFAGCNALSSVFLTSNCTTDLPICLPRMKICAQNISRWLPYVSMESAVSTTLVPSQGFSVVLGGDLQPTISATVLDEDTTFSIFELVEYPDLLHFHLATLETFTYVSSHGNIETAAAIGRMVDTAQLLQSVKLEGVDHSLKAAYFELLSVLHLQPAVEASLMTKGQLIIPLSQLTCSTATISSHKSSLPDALSTWSLPSQETQVISSFTLDELKELVLQSLKQILAKDYFTTLCSPTHKEKTNPLVPLLRVLDSLLIVGNLKHKADFDSLLGLLDPSAFGKDGCGLLSMDVTKDEPTKLALCSLLQHLCDHQALCHAMAVISFAQGYVIQLGGDQEKRYAATSWEFRSPTDIQLAYMLNFTAKECPTNPSLQKALNDFCAELASCLGGDLQGLRNEEMSLQQKLEHLWVRHHKSERSASTESTSLQCLIRDTMLVWARECIRDPSLVEKIFLLLFQQFDMVEVVIQNVKSAYIVDDTSGLYNISQFQHALGTLRSLVKVTMGKGEDKILKKSLNDIKNSGLFYSHPSLMCSCGVHTVVITILRQYLNMGSVAQESFEQMEICCKFLCSFARINHDTQQAIFEHLEELLEFMKLYPAVMTIMSTTPLDVAIVAIRNNTELAMTLNEAHLESVVSILMATTTSGETWSPVGGKRCLDFLQCAVWSNNDQIENNAYIVVRLLIRHSRCLGPALDYGVGLSETFQENLRLMSSDELLSGEECQTKSPSLMQSLLSFYASLLQLLGYCCHSQHAVLNIAEVSQEQRSLIDRTRHILKNLVSRDDVTKLILLPFDPNGRPLLLPLHKRAALHFVERVYGLTEPEYTLKLLIESFLPDVRLALQFLDRNGAPLITQPLLGYICDAVLPALTRHSTVFQQLHRHLHTIQNLLSSVYRMLYAAQGLSLNQLDQISEFIIAVIQNLHPRAILPFARKILGIGPGPFIQPQAHAVFKVFTAHYEHFAKFFDGSQGTAKTISGFPGEEEKTTTAQVVYHFIKGLNGEVLVDKQLLQEAVSCLKVMVVALPPNCHVPPFSTTALPASETSIGYKPRPPDVSGVTLFPEIIQVVNGFARYQHDCYVFDKQSEGWTYGTELNEECLCDPRLVPFDSLSQEYKVPLLADAELNLKLLLFRGWALNKVPPLDTRSIPCKVKNICILQKNSHHVPYEPEVFDLSKLEVTMEILALAEHMAEDMHEFWAYNLSRSSSDYSSNPSYCPYELLGDHIKEQRRAYALDLIKYLGVLGFQPLPSREMASFSFQPQAATSMTKFGLQLFGILTKHLALKPRNFNLLINVMFPILTAYLNRYHQYFLRHKYPSAATKEERTKIIDIFFSLITFASENRETLFPAPLSVANTGHVSVASSNMGTCVLRLINTVTKAFDARILTDNSKGFKSAELSATILAFFKEASVVIEEATSGLVTATSMYCHHALLPILTQFLQHLQSHNATKFIIQGEVIYHCQNMFESLWGIATKEGGLSHITSNPLAAIGQCLGALSTTDLKLFQNDGEFHSSVLQKRLENACGTATESDEVSFAAFVLVPILANLLCKAIEEDEAVEDPDVEHSLTLVWTLLSKTLGAKTVPWVYQVVGNTHGLTKACSIELLASQLFPLITQTTSSVIALYHEELLAREHEQKDLLKKVHEGYKVLARDMVAALSYLAAYLNVHYTKLRRDSSSSPLLAFFNPLADILFCWSHSQMFQRHLQSETEAFHQHISSLLLSASKVTFQGHGVRNKPTLLAFCMQAILTLKLHTLVAVDRELVDLYSDQKSAHAAKLTIDDLKTEIIDTLEAKTTSQTSRGRQLVKRISSSFMLSPQLSFDARALQVAFLSRAKCQLNQIDSPGRVHHLWKQVITRQKKAAVVKCFNAVPFFKLKKPQAINSFLQAISQAWHIPAIQPSSHHVLAQLLLSNDSFEDSCRQTELRLLDPLKQFFSVMKRSVLSHDISGINEKLYTAYTSLLSENVLTSVEYLEDNPAVEMQHLTKCILVERQEQLSIRGAAGIVTAMITASNGVICPIAYSTLKLGIVLLMEGNKTVQDEILGQLFTMDIGFLSSIGQFIAQCSVMDWTTYNRQRKMRLMGTDASQSALTDHDFTIALFRFLQLLCEGHNSHFQNYLRTQSGKSTTLNIVGCTVDYLLRLQESITDFYHHYSGDGQIELIGRQTFSVAFKVAKQVIRTLTEYVQGPCVENQQGLANSRLWDAVSGFVRVFSAMQRHLYLHSGHIELLRELLGLQEELFILLRSMLEGSAISSNIGRLMVDTLMDTSSLLEDITSFFSMFVKLQDVAICEAFKNYDLNKDGFISRKEFEKALTSQQKYSMAEIEYLMDCADSNHDGILDYAEFTARFHQPAQDIGFHLCVLTVQLSECLPQDKRLKQFRSSTAAIELLDHFKSHMGCVEIIGKSHKVERLYFELQTDHLQQWKTPQIQDTYKEFLHTVDMSNQRAKLSDFVDFCEDTIFEIDNACAVSGSEEQMSKAREVLEVHTGTAKPHVHLRFLSQPASHRQKMNGRHYVPSLLLMTWMLVIAGMSKVKRQGVKFVRSIISHVKRKDDSEATPERQGIKSCQEEQTSDTYDQLVTSYLPKLSVFKQNWQGFFACHYLGLTNVALITTFLINLSLLEFKMVREDVKLEDSTILPWLLTLMVFIHFVTSCSTVISYCCLMVPVIIFKREKAIARNMDSGDSELPVQSLAQRWDRLAAMSKSFPRKYWDKQVNKSSNSGVKRDSIMNQILSIMDVHYIIWAFGVVLTDKHVLYRICYCAVSFLGLQYSVFFFAFHLLDFVHNFKLVRTVLRSVLHNGKQLLMTMLMTTVIIYIYTVVAFNFFRKYYPKEAIDPDGEGLHSCSTMTRCFLFHINQGLRSGGGIADVLEPAAGDSYEFLRLFFDITFFFIVIVILLAIIQGLIVDAFGQLRDEEDAITQEMQTKCFICGLNSSEFDRIPHGFDNHVNKDHCMAHYMFLLLYLIKKRQSEFSGQESFVWEMYLKRDWDFFPVGKCFQLQETTSSETAD